ncbi:MAG: ABC transporter substrate-binding protein [Chloroflexota bacterium]
MTREDSERRTAMASSERAGHGGLAGHSGPRATRRQLAAGVAPVIGALAAACSTGQTPAGSTSFEGPKEINWVGYQSSPDRQALFEQSFKASGEANGVTVNVTWEGGNFWEKRQAEFAGGSTSADIMVLNLDWVIPGGLAGMFVDHNEYLRRDKVDTKQYYKAGLDTWSWKGKQWAIPLQAGGELVLYNKQMFDEKGVKHPTKDWTYDDLLAACQKLNDPANNKFAIHVGQNGLHYMMATFVYNFGGKLLNDAKDKALYGDDANSIQGASLDVDLHVKYKYTPTDEARESVRPVAPFDAGIAAMEINGSFRHNPARLAIGAENLDFAPPPKGPRGHQTAAVGGNGWAISALSQAKEAAWRCLKWMHTKEGMLGPQLKAVSWPPVVWAASSPEWLEIFKGTHIGDVAKVWETGGHDFMVVPEGSKAWSAANEPMGQAIDGEIATRAAMQESARALNELFARRPAEWK